MKDIVKLKNKRTNVEKQVSKAIASDYLGTNEWEMAKTNSFKESKKETQFSLKKDEE